METQLHATCFCWNKGNGVSGTDIKVSKGLSPKGFFVLFGSLGSGLRKFCPGSAGTVS